MKDIEPPASAFKSRSGVKRIFSAISYSIQGFRTAWRSEHSFRQEVMVTIPVAITALLLPVSRLEKLALISVLLIVLMVELINSAIEAAIDRISLERHPLAKNAKDFGSAAVCLALTLAAATWGTIVLPLLLR
jgi:diacylglycerol kinase (ATP)